LKIILPEITTALPGSLDWSIAERRSCRDYSDAVVEQQQLARLLWAAQGTTGDTGQKAAPSAGAQYPLEIHVVASRVENVPMGVYRYQTSNSELECAIEADLQATLYEAALDEQSWVKQAALILVLVADFDAMQSHFHEQPPEGERGDRYIYLESGAMAQNICLQSTSLGLGAVIVGGFDDEQVSTALNLATGIRPTALICIGVRE
jgi:SagB-type dehydrogenase family enzyme